MIYYINIYWDSFGTPDNSNNCSLNISGTSFPLKCIGNFGCSKTNSIVTKPSIARRPAEDEHLNLHFIINSLEQPTVNFLFNCLVFRVTYKPALFITPSIANIAPIGIAAMASIAIVAGVATIFPAFAIPLSGVSTSI